MTPRELSGLHLKRQEYGVILYLAEGEATLEELCQALGVGRTQGYEALSPLVRRGLVEKVNGRYRLAFALELPQAQPSPAPASPSEEKAEPKPKGAKGEKPKPESPVAALAEAHPHLKGLLYFAGKSLLKLAQPLAAKAPGVLVRAALAARKYGRDQEQAVLASWLADVRSWVDTWGAEAVEEALAQAAKKAEKPFPYARKLLLAKPELTPELPEEELGYF
jgi:pyruvate/2-oxoglutarate dehydrogenase complex dihydrolipoamide acyltransferase (E2) component